MNHQVKVFELRKDAKPDERPQAVEGFAVAGYTLEEARQALLARLAAEGRTVRSVSFTEGGGLAAVVNPAPTRDTASKGGR